MVSGSPLKVASEWPQLQGPAHGFCDDAETRRLLRSRPPLQALLWVEHAVGGRVIAARALRGGMSSAVHSLTVENPGAPRRRVVLRRSVRPEVNAEEPDLIAHEARSLRLVERLTVPTPQLLAVDPSGDVAGVPALLMTQLRGRINWWPSVMEHWLRALANVLPQIHSAPLPPAGLLPTYAAYHQTDYRPPPWSQRPRLWERAVEVAFGPMPDKPLVLVQRDFHPGNVLWLSNRVSGVVDWQATSVGPAAVDVAHCRANLLSFDRRVADRFTAIWEEETGDTFHPWADVVTIVGFLDDLQSRGPAKGNLLELVLADAIDQL